jgi:hypothetical protein
MGDRADKEDEAPDQQQGQFCVRIVLHEDQGKKPEHHDHQRERITAPFESASQPFFVTLFKARLRHAIRPSFLHKTLGMNFWSQQSRLCRAFPSQKRRFRFSKCVKILPKIRLKES